MHIFCYFFRFVCKAEGCIYESNNRTNYNNHSKIHQEKSHLCTECGKSYHLAEALRKHMIVNHTNEKIMCNVCGKEFSNAMSLR